MIDYKGIIGGVLDNLYESFYFVDPNEKIDAVLNNKGINWYPPYLVVCEGQFFIFVPFCHEHFIDESQIREECSNAQHLVKCLRGEGKDSKVFFITSENKDVKALEQQNLSGDFGILHNEWEKPLLHFSIDDIFEVKCRILPDILKYLSNCRNIKGKIGSLVRKFSKIYLKEEPEEDDEDRMIKELMKQIFTCDKRFKMDPDSINFMAGIERIVASPEVEFRDHYFHAFNTMMLGFMIIDKAYNRFDALAKKHGDDIVLEFVWILTSLYHDIGYPTFIERYLFCQTHGVEIENNPSFVDSCVKQNRQQCWDSENYRFVVGVLNDLFSHIIDNRGEKWVFDGFSRQIRSTKFKDSVKVSFVEEGAHGAAGALQFAVLTNKHVKDIKVNKDREFLYRHRIIASMSILFHDSRVRECFRKNSVEQIKAEDFLFSVLLAYVDILQDDRRDWTGSSSRPDIFKGVDIVDEKKIIAKLEEESLSEGVRNKLLEELKEALSFFIMNGLTFAIPEELSAKRA